MNISYLSKLSYYKQLHNFYYLIAYITHQSWLNEIALSSKIALDPHRTRCFQSQYLLERYSKDISFDRKKYGLFLFIASLPTKKFTRFLNYLVLALLKNDHSLLINGIQLQRLAKFLSLNELNFLLYDKNIYIKIDKKFSLPITQELTAELFLQVAYSLLFKFINHNNEELFARVKLRFPKYFTEAKIDILDIDLEQDRNISTLNSIAQLLFKNIYKEFEAEEIIK